MPKPSYVDIRVDKRTVRGVYVLLMTSSEQLIAKWNKWIKPITEHVQIAFHHRNLWDATTDAIIEVAKRAPSTWISHYSTLYGDAQLMAIRRVVRTQQDSISLTRLLNDIAAHPTVPSVDYYLSLSCNQDPLWLEHLSVEYDSLWGDGSGRVDPEKPTAAAKDLNDRLDAVFKYGDRKVAHIDKRNIKASLTHRELDEALDTVGRYFQHWAKLVTGTHFELTPIVHPNWHKTFERPLFPPLPTRRKRP